MAKKAVKASKPVDDLEVLLRAGALRRLQGSTAAKPNAKPKAKGKKR